MPIKREIKALSTRSVPLISVPNEREMRLLFHSFFVRKTSEKNETQNHFIEAITKEIWILTSAAHSSITSLKKRRVLTWLNGYYWHIRTV